MINISTGMLFARQAGALPPLEQASSTNHGPYLVSASYTLLILMIIVVLFRLISRYLVSNPKLDDLFIFLASTVAIGQSILVQFAADQGLGRHQPSLSETEFAQFSKFNYAAQLLFIVVLVFSRLSVSALINSLRPSRSNQLANRICAGFIIIWGVIALFSLAFPCTTPYPWMPNSHNTCVNRPALYTAIDITSILTDLSLIIIPIFVMLKVQVTWTKRATVISLFGLRLLVITITVMKLVISHEYFANISTTAGVSTRKGSTENDGTWTLLIPTIWRQAEMMLSIICACLPSLKRLLEGMRPGLNGVSIPLALEHSLSTAYDQDCVRANFDSHNRSVQFGSPGGKRPSDAGLTATNTSSEGSSGTLLPGINKTKVKTGKKVATPESEPLYGPIMLSNLDAERLREVGIVQKTDVSVTLKPMHRRGSSSLSNDPLMRAMMRSSHHMV